MGRTSSSRNLAELCQRDVACIHLVGRATPDYHTIGEFWQRFTGELKGLVAQVLGLCAEAGLVRLGHVSLDGTKVRANASRHKAMSYRRMLEKEARLAAEVDGWLEAGKREDAEEDAEYGPDDDGWRLPPEMRRKQERLERIQEAKARLEERAREQAEARGEDAEAAEVPPKAQSNFTDPESCIMKGSEGFQQCYNAQAAVEPTARSSRPARSSTPHRPAAAAHARTHSCQHWPLPRPVHRRRGLCLRSELCCPRRCQRHRRSRPPPLPPRRTPGRRPGTAARLTALALPHGHAGVAVHSRGQGTVSPTQTGRRAGLRPNPTGAWLPPVPASWPAGRQGEWNLVSTAHNVLKLDDATAFLCPGSGHVSPRASTTRETGPPTSATASSPCFRLTRPIALFHAHIAPLPHARR